MARKGGLGKGLDALIPSKETPQADMGVSYLSVDQIVANPRQPRQIMEDEGLQELADSIREHGILQPLIVTFDAQTGQYTLIAGERRLRAARLAGLQQVPVLYRQVTDQERLELALIENVQRADLTPLETAEAYRQLHEDFGIAHEEIAAAGGQKPGSGDQHPAPAQTARTGAQCPGRRKNQRRPRPGLLGSAAPRPRWQRCRWSSPRSDRAPDRRIRAQTERHPPASPPR